MSLLLHFFKTKLKFFDVFMNVPVLIRPFFKENGRECLVFTFLPCCVFDFRARKLRRVIQTPDTICLAYIYFIHKCKTTTSTNLSSGPKWRPKGRGKSEDYEQIMHQTWGRNIHYHEKNHFHNHPRPIVPERENAHANCFRNRTTSRDLFCQKGTTLGGYPAAAAAHGLHGAGAGAAM